jgi:probable HAF family extracellular repeat protein
LGVNGTAATGINNLGQIVGYYLDSNNFQHGYLYSNGTYVTLDDPLGSHGTVATGINDSGQIVGFYLDGSSPFPPVWGSSATTKMASITLSSLRPSASRAPSQVLDFPA